MGGRGREGIEEKKRKIFRDIEGEEKRRER